MEEEEGRRGSAWLCCMKAEPTENDCLGKDIQPSAMKRMSPFMGPT